MKSKLKKLIADNLTPRVIAKTVTAGVVAAGVHRIVKGVIKTTTPVDSRWDKITIGAATFVMTGVVVTAAKSFTHEFVDEIFDTLIQARDEIGLSLKLDRINENQSTFLDEGLDPVDFVRNQKTGKWQPKQVIAEEQ